MWARVDRGTRRYWKTFGRQIDLDGKHSWLRAPVLADTAGVVEDNWLLAEAERVGGWFVTRFFGRRVGQLALPIRSLDTARGIDSRVERLVGADGANRGAAWLRTSRATGEYIYSGFYRVARLPGSDQPSVHVSFPLPVGNVQVFLRPEVGEDGALRLVSPPGAFGADGAYVTVVEGDRCWAARIPIYEEFHVFADGARLLRTDHTLALGRATALGLHYLLMRD
ncbi:hypothetical protein [Nocardia sp. NPDC019395]|uniref:hypothetical protein n=1 Tax=Nocardia sp. NPDC019395 TaxID=3154686 RepID=UPI0033D451F8